jgi:putative transposase
MKNTPKADLVIDALLMAVWRRKPKGRVLIHSDQGVQYTCSDWRSFLKDNNLQASMSRRGNCWDNAVAESFFSLMKRERIRGRIYPTRHEARADIFDYIELFITREGVTETTMGYHPYNMKSSIMRNY